MLKQHGVHDYVYGEVEIVVKPSTSWSSMCDMHEFGSRDLYLEFRMIAKPIDFRN